MSVEENMALTRRFLEALLTGNLEAMDEVMAADFVSHDLPFSSQAPKYASKTRWPEATR